MWELKEWNIACEYGIVRLHGLVYGRRPRFLDGESIHTSCIEKIEGRTVTTTSGSVYELGPASQFFKDRYNTTNLEDIPYANQKVDLDAEDLTQLVDKEKIDEYTSTA